MICDCPQVTHEHGDLTMYLRHACRCAECKEATRQYSQSYTNLKRLGKFRNRKHPVNPVRDRLLELRDEIGLSYTSQLTGISRRTLDGIIDGKLNNGNPRRSVSEPTYRKIMFLQVPPYMERPDNQLVPAAGTIRRIQALMACGYSAKHLGRVLGVTGRRVSLYFEQPTVKAGTARTIRDVYEKYWNVPPAASSYYERGGITRTLNAARRNGWKPPMFWDDDRIDDPTYTPVVPEIGDRRAVNRQLFIQEVEHLASMGDRLEAIAQRFDMSPGAVEKRLCRYGRADLAKRIGWEREDAA
ncbi:hypothetical protein GCM10009526_23670 [Glutamicibacter creatinolyticus]